MMRLYDYVMSADCYKVRLLLRMLELPYEPVKINIHPGKEHLEPAFRTANPLGRIPVLEDGDLRLGDPQAILVYLAAKYDPQRRWYPDDPATAGRIAAWLAFAGRELRPLHDARFNDLTGNMLADDPNRAPAQAALEILEDHLAEREIEGGSWIAADWPTIADVALFPDVALAEEGGVPLDPFPAIWRWLARFKRLPRFSLMPGIFPLMAAS